MLQGLMKYAVDINKPAVHDTLDIFLGDKEEYQIVLTLNDGEEPAAIDEASVSAYMLLADQTTCYWQGVASGNIVTVTIKDAAHRIEGHAQLAIRVNVGDVSRTVYTAQTNIKRVSTNVMIDQDDVIPSLDDLLAHIKTIEQVVQSANTATTNASNAANSAFNAASRANQAAQTAENVAKEFDDNGVRVDLNAAPLSIKLPTWDEHEALQRQVDGMASLPNPYKLTFTGAVQGEYDGSAPIAVNIPEGGGGGTDGSGENGATFIPRVENGVLKWSNDKGLPNPPDVDIRGLPGADGIDGTTFFPSIDENGWLYWNNIDGLDNPAPSLIKGQQGDPGVTFKPHVAANGDLSWTNEAGLENPPTVNIKGPKGDGGSGSTVELDTTLKVAGKAADSKAAGDAIGDVAKAIGTLTDLETTAKGDLVAAINETFTSVSEGKAALASALADKEQEVDAGATFAVIADAIRAISGTPSFDGMQFGYFTPDANQTTVTINHTLGEIPTCVIIADTSNVSNGTTLRQIANIYTFNRTNGAVIGYSSFSLFANSSTVMSGVVQGGLASASNVRVNGASLSSGSASLPFLASRKYMYIIKGGDK